MKAVIFDLDDTLYREYDYVLSGFRAVAKFVTKECGLDDKRIFDQLVSIVEQNGRGKVFNVLCAQHDLDQERFVKKMVTAYRTHLPNINLFDGVEEILSELHNKSCMIGLITDGMASVQRNKVKVLGLEDHMQSIVYTDELEGENAKPSQVPYEQILNEFDIDAEVAAYVGDNPYKDFHAPKVMGMMSIQLEQNGQRMFYPESQANPVPADYVVNALDKILPIILKDN